MSLSVTVFSFLVSKTHMKWQNSPVIVSLDEKPTSIHEISFPAIIICPEIKFNRSLHDDQIFSQNITNGTQVHREAVPFNDVFYECIGEIKKWIVLSCFIK